MSEITDADRKRAAQLVASAATYKVGMQTAIAQALADQRAELEAAFDAAYEGLRQGVSTETEWAAVERDFEEGTSPAESRPMAEAEVGQNNQAGLPSYLGRREVRYGPWVEVKD